MKLKIFNHLILISLTTVFFSCASQDMKVDKGEKEVLTKNSHVQDMVKQRKRIVRRFHERL